VCSSDLEKSENAGMRTFDSALYHLYKAGKITLEEALKNADSKNNLRLKISLDEADVAKNKTADLTGGLSLVSKDPAKGH
jgi:twitching motility protein PilU